MEYRPQQSLPPADVGDAIAIIAWDVGTGWTIAGFVLDGKVEDALAFAIREDATLADRTVTAKRIRGAELGVARRREAPPAEPPPIEVAIEPLPDRSLEPAPPVE